MSRSMLTRALIQLTHVQLKKLNSKHQMTSAVLIKLILVVVSYNTAVYPMTSNLERCPNSTTYNQASTHSANEDAHLDLHCDAQPSSSEQNLLMEISYTSSICVFSKKCITGARQEQSLCPLSHHTLRNKWQFFQSVYS